MLVTSPLPNTRKGKFLMPPQFIILQGRAKNITGQQFGRLLALGPIGRNKKSQIKWLCRCECGKTVVVEGGNLRGGHTQSCGCIVAEKRSTMHASHGLSNDPLYSVWSGVIRRCTNPNDLSFGRYGGRGITICDEWRHDFQAFYDHVSKLPDCLEDGYTLDRADNSLGYMPGNVRWVTAIEQSRNRRNNHMITYGGKTQCLQAWANELGIRQGTLSNRFKRGWSAEKALTQPTQKSDAIIEDVARWLAQEGTI